MLSGAPRLNLLVGTGPVKPPAHWVIGLRTALAAWLLLAVGCAGQGAVPVDGPPARERGAAPLAILALRETFGVSHPQQLVEFAVPGDAAAAPVHLTDLDGRDVPVQVLRDGRLAVLTDLPAFGERRWILRRAPAPVTPEGGVLVRVHRAYYEITNGLTGVRIARFPADLSSAPAPIQGLRHRDGTWAATGPNYLEGAPGRDLSAVAAGVRFLERGPLKVVAEVTYRFRHDTARTESDRPPSYRSTIEVQARQPVVLVEDETEVDLRYRLDLHEGLHPDQARYRGHYSTSPERGREPDGRQYRRGHERPMMDAVVDLPGSRGGRAQAAVFQGRLAVWDPWIGDGGWYWQLYDSRGPAESNVFGVFSGRASRAIGATESGIRVFAGPRGPGTTPAGILFEANRRTSDSRVFPRIRVAWGIFVGTKGSDLADPLAIQAIGQQMNLHAGMNLNKLPSNGSTDPGALDPRDGLYMDEGRMRTLAERVGHDEALYRWLYGADPTARPLLDLWRAPSDTRRAEMAGAIARGARDVLEALVHGGGIYDSRTGYWLGGLTMTRLVPWISALLADPRTATDDRARIAAAAALFGSVLWDDDFVPLFPGHGLHLGTENMPVQQREYRSQYALLLRSHPGMAARAARVPGEVSERLHAVVDESGAQISSPHYVSASMGPLLTTLQQLKTAGADLFAGGARLGRFAEFLLNLLTPPEPRFGGLRKLVSIGDGSTESCELCGQLGTGLAEADPALSRRLMGAWRASGEPHSGFFGTSIVKIDADLPGGDPALTSRSFPGWYSVLRSGWGTPEETALWLIHGTTYRDHYHDDNGSLVAYVLGVPVILDWGSTYSPRAAGGVMHSVILPERLFGHPWDRGDPPLDAGPRWAVAGPPRFAAFRHSAHAAARFGLAEHAWTREVALMHGEPGRPIILIRDRIVGGAGSPPRSVLSLNLAAQGPVQTPAGPILPPHVDPARGEAPSAGRVFGLGAGWSHLAFMGQWGVDWDLFVWLPAEGQAHIGQWAHAWHPGRQALEFQRSQGRAFEERQYVLRVLGTTAFDALLVPRRRDAPPDTVTVRQVGGVTELARTVSRLWLHESGYVLDDGGRTVVTAVGEAPVRAAGLAVAGGAAEITLTGHVVQVTPRGPAGRRWIDLPGDCALDGLVPVSEGTWVVEYAGDESSHVSGTCGPLPRGPESGGPGPAERSSPGAG